MAGENTKGTWLVKLEIDFLDPLHHHLLVCQDLCHRTVFVTFHMVGLRKPLSLVCKVDLLELLDPFQQTEFDNPQAVSVSRFSMCCQMLATGALTIFPHKMSVHIHYWLHNND